MPARPPAGSTRAPPRPSSTTTAVTAPASRANVIVVERAPACLPMLARHSATAKYSADSTGAGSRSPSDDDDRRRRRQLHGERLDGADEAAVGEHGWVDAPDDGTQVGQRVAVRHLRLLEQLAGRVGIALDGVERHAERHAGRHEASLGAVVEVALDAPQLGGLDVDGVGASAGERVDALLQQPHPGVGGRAEQGAVDAGDQSHQQRRHVPPQQERRDDQDVLDEAVGDGLGVEDAVVGVEGVVGDGP